MLCEACRSDFNKSTDPPKFCEECCAKVHSHSARKTSHNPELCREMNELRSLSDLDLVSVICIETSHYVCFTRKENQWIFFDSMANRVCKHLFNRHDILRLNLASCPPLSGRVKESLVNSALLL